MKPSSAKQKGRLLQQKVRDEILKRFPELEPDDCRSTSMGASGADVQLSPAAKRLVSYEIECKSLAAVGVYKFYEQAKTHGKLEPLVVVKQNGSKPLAIVDLEHFLDLVRKIQDGK
jgi:hypothetical protein